MPFRPSETCLVCHSADLDRTARFYREAFDISFDTRGSGPDAFLFARLSPDFSISFNQGRPEPGKSPILTFTLAEGGIADAITALAASGATIVSPVSPAPAQCCSIRTGIGSASINRQANHCRSADDLRLALASGAAAWHLPRRRTGPCDDRPMSSCW